jgi:hypothetical protein
MTPTVLFVNHEGEVVGNPILGGDHTNYIALFDKSLAEASTKIAGKRVRIR